jgi:type I restriction enzyme S subunit
MMKIESKVPQLRFKEFNTRLNRDELGSLGKFLGGGTPDTENNALWEGEIPWISSSDIISDDIHKVMISRKITKVAIKESATKLIPKDALLFVSRVGVGKLALAKQDLCTSQDFTNFISKGINPIYTAYFFQSNVNLLKRYSQGTSIKGITSKELGKIPVIYGDDDEQKKIASFLSTIDKKISLLKQKHEQLIQYRKGIMQQLFCQQVRFKDDSGQSFPDWKSVQLKSILLLQSNPIDMQDDEEYELITAKRRNGGIVSRGIYLGKEVLVKSQFELKENQFVISKRQIVHGACGLVPKYLEGAILSNEYNVFEGEPDILDIHYFNLFSKTPEMKKAYFRNSDGVHIEKLLFRTKDWLKTRVKLPSLDEQKRIVSFSIELEKKISLIQQQIEQTQAYKQGLLQQMFV